MSIEAVSLVLNHSKAQGRAKLVLIGIANHMGDQGAWPSIETLAKYANASERSVKRDIKELVDLGELVVELQQAPVRGQYKTNLYWITISGVTNGASGVTNGASGVTDWVSRGDTVVTHNHQLTIKEPSIKNIGDFDVFWNVYPIKLGKQAAVRAFAKAVAIVPVETIIAGAERYRDDPNRLDAFTKHASTWLNAGCWDDEPLPERVKSSDELARERVVKAQTERDKAIQSTQELLAEMERNRAEVAKDPIQRCEHGFKVVCKVCN